MVRVQGVGLGGSRTSAPRLFSTSTSFRIKGWVGARVKGRIAFVLGLGMGSECRVRVQGVGGSRTFAPRLFSTSTSSAPQFFLKLPPS